MSLKISISMEQRNVQGKEAIVVSVTLGRRLLGTFLTVYFPTILLNIIGYATNLFKPFFFEVLSNLSKTSINVFTFSRL